MKQSYSKQLSFNKDNSHQGNLSSFMTSVANSSNSIAIEPKAISRINYNLSKLCAQLNISDDTDSYDALDDGNGASRYRNTDLDIEVDLPMTTTAI